MDIASFDWKRIGELRDELRSLMSGAPSASEAAQRFVAALASKFQSVVLARVYATVPYAKLPQIDREFAMRSARTAGAAGLHEHTLCLSLLATAGVRPEWNDRRRSVGHLAIPLINSGFVEATPMLARLLTELGVDLAIFDQPAILSRRLLGGFNGLFYVADAAKALDARGRNIIPAQDFVTEHRVRTVFGMGGSYLDGSIATTIVFSRELLDRASAERFASVASEFKLAAMSAVSAGRIHG